MALVKLTVVAPVFAEEGNIKDFVNSVSEEFRAIHQKCQPTLLLVIDPSEDSTIQIVDQLALKHDWLRFICMRYRAGHQNCILTGIEHAEKGPVIMMDSDLQHPVKLISELFQLWLAEQKVELIQCVRNPTQRSLMSIVYYKIFAKFASSQIIRDAPDFRLISPNLADRVRARLSERSVFLRGLLVSMTDKIRTIEYQEACRKSGESKYDLKTKLDLAFSGVVNYSKAPLRVATYAGFAVAGLSFIFLFYAIVDFLFFGAAPDGWYSLAVLVTLVNGAVLVVLGLIGEYISIMFDEVKNRPRSEIERANFEV